MESLDPLYLRILSLGLNAARDAALVGDLEKCAAELQHVHNLPSLIGETNIRRHLYYISAEKTAYLESVMRSNRKEWKLFAASVYLPLWKRIEEILEVDKLRGKR